MCPSVSRVSRAISRRASAVVTFTASRELFKRQVGTELKDVIADSLARNITARPMLTLRYQKSQIGFIVRR